MAQDAQTHSWKDDLGTVHGGPVLAEKGPHTVIDCAKCGFRHVTPLPNSEELAAFYAEEFYGEAKPDYLANASRDAEWIDQSFAERLEKIANLLGSDSGRILDIGSGPGGFLAAGQKRGWQMVGVEPARQAAEFAREQGLEVVNAAFDAGTAADLGTFDVVHMNKVLEHLPNPGELLKLAAGLVRPDGLIVVSVPNDFNGFQESLVATGNFEPWWVVPDHHLNYFSYESLEDLLETSGFAPLSRDSDFPMEMFLLMGDDYTGDGDLGSVLHNKRKHFDMTLAAHGPSAKLAFYEALAAAGLGRMATVFARRSEAADGT